MAADMTELLDDLQAEHADLDALLVGADTSKPSAAAGWTVGDCVGHLWFFDREATTALRDPDAFRTNVEALLANPDGYMESTLEQARALGDDLPATAATQRNALLDALRTTDPGVKVPWYGPPMSPASFATARLMEYWAHGQDIADAVGVTRTPTARLRHVAHLGVRTRAFSYAVRGRTAPDSEVHVVLTGPGGEIWTWGEASAVNRVEGPAVDFCLVVTQRRHLDSTSLVVQGADAREWLEVAQAFAGGPTVTDPRRRSPSR